MKVIDFHIAHLVSTMTWLKTQGISNRDELADVRGTKLLSESLWKISEGSEHANPKLNLRYFSEDALKIAQSPGGLSAPNRKLVQHEHVIPRQLLENMLFACDADPRGIRRVALQSVGCVVTKVEHALLKPDPWNGNNPGPDPWRRYREARDGTGIKVWDRLVGDWVALTGVLPQVTPQVEAPSR